MEYKKEYDKFAFGIGTEKVAGKGNLAETDSKNVGLAEIAIPIALAAGAGLLNILRKSRKNKK